MKWVVTDDEIEASSLAAIPFQFVCEALSVCYHLNPEELASLTCTGTQNGSIQSRFGVNGKRVSSCVRLQKHLKRYLF